MFVHASVWCVCVCVCVCCSIRMQFITVFWWIYGRGPMDDALLLPTEYKQSQVTQGVGHLLAALYHITIIIVLVNLLIAMMARSFEKIVVGIKTDLRAGAGI